MNISDRIICKRRIEFDEVAGGGAGSHVNAVHIKRVGLAQIKLAGAAGGAGGTPDDQRGTGAEIADARNDYIGSGQIPVAFDIGSCACSINPDSNLADGGSESIQPRHIQRGDSSIFDVDRKSTRL